jgi:hypothetical protein
MPSGGRELVSVIESAIEEAYLHDEFTRFWPGQFISGDASEVQVVDALKDLVEQRLLNAEAFLHCPNDHIAWSGSPSTLTRTFAPMCPRCGEAASGEYVDLQFTMTPTWRSRLDRVAAIVQKKTPQNVNQASR